MTNSSPETKEAKKKKVTDILLGALFAFITYAVVIASAIFILVTLRFKSDDVFLFLFGALLMLVVVNVGIFIALYLHRRHMSIGWAITNGVMLLPFILFGMCLVSLG